jgi:hypothetical protein
MNMIRDTSVFDHKLGLVGNEMRRSDPGEPRTFRPASDILEELDTVASAMLRIPSAFVARDVLIALHADVVDASERPVEGIRLIDDFALFLACALLQIASVGPGGARWLRLAKALLPEIKEDLKRAREEELRQMQSEARR